MNLPHPDHNAYINAAPFSHAVFKLDWPLIKHVANEFPDLNKIADRKFDNKHERKLVTHGESKLGIYAKQLVHYLNSEPFLLWLSELTGIPHLMPDPYLIGGGYH